MNFGNLPQEVNNDSFRRVRKFYLTILSSVAISLTLGLELSNFSLFGINTSSSNIYLLYVIIGLIYFYARYRYNNISKTLKDAFMSVRANHLHAIINTKYRELLIKEDPQLNLQHVKYDNESQEVKVSGYHVKTDANHRRINAPYNKKIKISTLEKWKILYSIDRDLLKESNGFIFELYLPNIISLYIIGFIIIYITRGFFLMTQ